MKRFRLFFALLVAVSTATASTGGSWSHVTITEMWTYTNEGTLVQNVVLVQFSAASTGYPSCASANTKLAVIDTSTSGGMAAVSAAQLSMTTGVTVSVSGAGSCNPYAGVETLSSIAQAPNGG